MIPKPHLAWVALALLATLPTAAEPLPDAGSIVPSLGARVTGESSDRPADVPSDATLLAARARVGRIDIDPQPIFDTGIPEEDTRLFRLANRLHISTDPGTIASQLLFRSGESYDPRLLAESERLLRRTRYLRDATVLPVAWHDGVVDIRVTTRDVWTLSPGVSWGRAGGRNTSGLELEELNLLGRGSQITLKQKSEVDRDIRQLVYRDRQLGRSWWRIDAGLADNSDGHRYELTLEQPFFALQTRRSMGGAFVDDERVDSRYDRGEILDQYRTRQQAYSVFAGYSPGLQHGSVWRFTAGFERDARHFDATLAPLPTLLLPADRVLAGPFIGVEWLEDRFRTTRNRDQIERTEDYALGWHATLKLGLSDEAFGADRSALQFGASLHRGVRHGERHTWQFESSLTGRYEAGALADTVLDTSLRYYFRQSDRALFFAGLQTVAGTALDADRQITLGGDNGLRGYPLRYQNGTSRWLLTLEQRTYTDWYPFRLFNVGAAAFFDMGGTHGARSFGAPPLGTLRDVGLGLRLGNSRSGLGNVVHVDLAYPLDGARKDRGLQLLVETRRSF